LERITFLPGDEHRLDIASKFSEGLFAYNNESQRNAKAEDRKLIGERIRVRVELTAEYVAQTFDFEITSPAEGNPQIAIAPQVHSGERLVSITGISRSCPSAPSR